jgi:hypothetical protein
VTLACDYSFARPSPEAIKAAGYVAVLRYVSHDPAKDLSAGEAAALHTAGLGIGLAWETTATRATQGAHAGVVDGSDALIEAQALGYPSGLPIYFAVDENVGWASVADYFAALTTVAGLVVGIYGSLEIVEAGASAGIAWRWQAEAWSGRTVSPVAQLYQRISPTLEIAGAAPGDWDEDVVLVDSYPWWTSAPKAMPVIGGFAPVSSAQSQVRPLEVEIRGGKGWVPLPAPVGRIDRIFVETTNPDATGHYTLDVPTLVGVSSQPGPHSPYGVAQFSGPADGTFGVTVRVSP